jgi:hypothetical protein
MPTLPGPSLFSMNAAAPRKTAVRVQHASSRASRSDGSILSSLCRSIAPLERNPGWF